MSLVLFDLDGTLYSSRRILPEAYREGIEQFNRDDGTDVTIPSEEDIFDQVGKPAPEIYENLFPELNKQETVALQEQIFSALLDGIKQKRGELYEGVRETLDELDGHFSLGLVTNGQKPYMEAVLRTHELDVFFDRALSHDDARSGQKSELVEMMLESFDRNPGETLMVGDRRSDYQAASRNEVPFVLCRYGYGNRDRFPEESPILETLPDLLGHERLPEANLPSSAPDQTP